MPFAYHRTVRLADTDAAGLVFFARTFAMCHEAYEEALAAAGIELIAFLGGSSVIMPVARSEAEYLRPLRCGDKLRISVTPESVSEQVFIVRYEVIKLGAVEKIAARVRIEHVCTSPAKRQRAPLPTAVAAWVRAG